MSVLSRQAGRFLIVGGSAFLIGLASLEILTRIGLSPYIAQFPVLGLAVTYTWACNRRWTFAQQQQPSWQEYGRYVLASLGGMAVNALVFSGLTYTGLPTYAAFSLATLAAMFANFAGYRFFAFNR